MTDKAYAVPLHELLVGVPRDTRLEIIDPDGMGTRFIPVGRYCHEAAEALRARLAQPEPAECDGGQCGIGGYCKQCPKTQPEPDYEAEFIKDWNEGKVRRVSDGKRMVPEREWVGLTREELAEIAEFHFHGALSGREFYDDVETKLKEKNT
tara:strand:+ start:739 stop:1191 length:453 start_codon:yes stop_codon:yes gene_type:complete